MNLKFPFLDTSGITILIQEMKYYFRNCQRIEKNIMSMYTRYFEVFLERAHVVVSRFYYHARSYVSIKTRNSPPTRSSTHIFPLLLHIYPHLFIHPFRRVLFVRVKI